MENYKYHLSNNCLTIYDSYKITSEEDMENILFNVRINNTESNYEVLHNRTDKSFIKEWKSHNLLYNLHIFRSHTADVDMEYPLKWYYKLAWDILSIFYI